MKDKTAASDAARPQRVQLKRSAGWKMPPNTVKVDRTTRWGNPFTAVECGSVAAAVASHGRWMRGEIAAPAGAEPPSAEAIRAALAGRNLACWCPATGPCHAELLLAIANRREPALPSAAARRSGAGAARGNDGPLAHSAGRKPSIER